MAMENDECIEWMEVEVMVSMIVIGVALHWCGIC